jgi:hypothetical protein
MANLYQLPYEAIAGSIFLAKNLDTSKDIVVSFDYACYGTEVTGSEGFCVYFINAFADNLKGGGPGSGLCYAMTNGISAHDNGGIRDFYDGAYYGELGVGFDITGNFGTSGFGSDGGFTVPKSNTIAIRDSYNTKFNLKYRSESLSSSAYEYPFSLYQQRIAGDFEYRRVRVRLTDFCQRVIVDFSHPESSECFVNYADVYIPGDRPPSLNCCLSFASSFTRTSLKIKNFNINGFFTSLSGEESTDIFTYTAEPYLGLVPDPASLTVFDTISVVNAPPYNTGPILSNPLITVSTGTAPFEAGDNYILITPL